MSFKPILGLVEVKKDGSTVTVKDTTGTYHATNNPGGYGTPNPNISTRIGLSWRYWGSDTVKQFVSTVISLQSNYEITPFTFGLDGNFSDGVHHFRYYPLYAISGTYTITQGTSLVTRATGSVDLSTLLDTALYTVVEINGVLYSVDFTKPVTATTFYITEEFTSATITTAINRGALADLKVFIDKAAAKVYCQNVYAMSTQDCECDESINICAKILMYLQAADIEMTCKNYTKAHNLVSTLAINYSVPDKCPC